MMFKRAAWFLGLLALSTPALAGTGTFSALSDVRADAPPTAGAPISVSDLAPRLKPRPIPTEALRVTPYATGQLIVKFEDDLRMRLSSRGTVRSLSAVAIDPVNDVIEEFGLTFRPAFNQDEARINAILQRAEQASGRRQPDLAGMMIVQVDRTNLLAAARALNDLPQVEWVDIEEHLFPGAMAPMFGGDEGACCLPDNTCLPNQTETDCVVILGGFFMGAGQQCAGPTCGACCLPPAQECQPRNSGQRCLADGGTWQGNVPCPPSNLCGACCLPPVEEVSECIFAVEASCVAQGGIYTSDGTGCFFVDCDNLTATGCGDVLFGNCFQPGGNGSPFCDNADCCELVCELIDPFCCNDDFGEWDQTCVFTANLLCSVDDGADRCATIFNDGCFEPSTNGGCSDSACCNLICGIEESCCEDAWDGFCVLLARVFCAGIVPEDTPTPDFEPLQGHLAAAPLDPFAFPGYNGVGLNLIVEGEPFEDLNGNGWWDPGEPFDDLNGDGFWTPPGGLWGVAEELLRVYGVDQTGQGNLSRGRTVRIAVIEWGFYQGHEDLDVWVEPGQTLIDIPEITEPDHGTASLGVAGARNDGVGTTGVAPDANLLFFPLTSVEEGPRQFSAWLSAIDVLRAGDVISCSYGPPANLNNTRGTWELIRLAADLGITACIAAGNGCDNLDGAPDFGDSGGIVVGATSPGSPHYRLAFSNYYTEPDPLWERSNVVHVNAWGQNVVTTGYGDLFIPEGPPGADFNRRRSYTSGYSGTSAATPQIAGVIACLQGFAKQFYGIPLATDVMRGVIAADAPAPSLRGGPAGFDPDEGCSLDLDPDEGPHRVGGYPDLAGSFSSAASTILNQTDVGFDGSPLIQDILILNGQWLFGNKFSVKGIDNNFLVIESRFVNRSKPFGDPDLGGGGHRPGLNLEDVPEARAITYLSSGQITDVIAVAQTNLETPTAMTIEILYGQVDVFSLGFIEVFNWQTRRWQFFALGLLDAGEAGVIEAGSLSAIPFVREKDGRVLVRTWTLGFTGDNPIFGPGKYRTRIDLIGLDIDTAFGEQ